MENKKNFIKVIDNIVIFSDGTSYVVAEKDNSELGYRKPSYFNNMKQTVKGAISKRMKLKVRDGEINSLRHWLNEEKAVAEEIEKAFGFLDE